MTSAGIPPPPTMADQLRTARQAINVTATVIDAHGTVIAGVRDSGTETAVPIPVVLQLLASLISALAGATDAHSLSLDVEDVHVFEQALERIEQLKAEPLVKS